MEIEPVVLDSGCWIAWFAGEPVAKAFADLVAHPEHIFVPAIVKFEVYRWALRTLDPATAQLCVGLLHRGQAVSVDGALALRAAELAGEHKLAMADALIYATGVVLGVPILTADGDLEHLPGVRFFPQLQRSLETPKAKRAASRRPRATS